MKTLLVIIPDALSTLIIKGEITERYYNPGNLFDEVHILMTNDDHPNPCEIQKTVGSAKLYLHNMPLPSFHSSLGWQLPFVKAWAKPGIRLVQEICPSLIRTHNNFIEGYLASIIRNELGIPYVISLHGVWDRDCLISTRERVIREFRKKFEYLSLQNADAVLAVYQPIIRYAQAFGAKNVHLVYNVVARDVEKKTYNNMCNPPKLITINRQLKEKNPENIIRAVKDIDCNYLIVGDGVYHDYLKNVAKENGCDHKVEFVKAIPNEQICKMLKDFDIMVSHCDYWGISKTIIEASLAGLPIIINQHPIEPIPEYEGDWLLLCENSPEGYRDAILSLVQNISLWRKYGQQAFLHAKNNFDPEEMEKRVVDIYKGIIENTP